jgi:hypothetical protein
MRVMFLNIAGMEWVPTLAASLFSRDPGAEQDA